MTPGDDAPSTDAAPFHESAPPVGVEGKPTEPVSGFQAVDQLADPLPGAQTGPGLSQITDPDPQAAPRQQPVPSRHPSVTARGNDVVGASQGGSTGAVGNTTQAAPVPTVGRIVHYALTETDAATINNTGQRVHCDDADVKAGDKIPMIITRVFGEDADSAVNGQVFLDGSDTLWIRSTSAGEGNGKFTWPNRA